MSVGEDGATDPFPVGMRVLAVDDDPICLKVLENLLRKCLYQVATANQAAAALKMLREDPDKYDLVISDVNMPGINGFKLLELIGLEMDLPVIMLSAHSDTETVMKGITHGACDYLLKPVRIEELKNIWQHVVRKKKFEPNKVLNQDKDHAQAGGGQGVTSSGNGDQSEKSNRKRKEHSDDDEEEDGDEDGPENDSSQKKPRVVWCVDLHRKFVAAVNQLGLDKAVPKKILDLMNVERLSRENVASHLQKYRLYLKRISQQANMATLAGRNSSYAHMCSLDGYGDFQALTGSVRFSNTSLSSYPPGSVLGRLNSPAGLSNSQNLTNSLNSLGTCHSSILPSNRSASLFQGIPTSLDFNQLQQRKMAPHLITGLNPTNDPTTFVGTSYQETSSSIGCPSNSFGNSTANPLILQGNPQQGLYRAGFSNQSSLRAGPSHPSSIEMGPSCSSTFLDENRSNDCWQSGVQLAHFPSNSLPLSEPFSHASNNMIDGISSSGSHILTNPTELASTGAVQCQRGLIGNAVQNTDFGSNQMCGMGYNYGMNNSFSPMDSLLSSNGVMGLDQNNSVSGKSINASLISQPVTPSAIQHSELDNSAIGTRMRSNEYLMEQTKAQDGFIHDSLNDLLNVMNKRNDTGQHYQEENINKMHTHLDGSCI